jgi:O-antigen ligase
MTLKISKWLFLLLVFSIPFVRPFDFYLFGLKISATDLIFPAAFAFWLIALLRKQARFRPGKFYYFLGFYGLALIGSTVLSVYPRQSFYKLLAEIYLLSLAVLTFNLIDSLEFLKKAVFAWLAGTFFTFLAAMTGFLLFYVGYKTQENNFFLYHFGTLPSGNYPRVQALFANANLLCNYLNIGLMFVFLAGSLGWLNRFQRRFLHFGIWFTALFTFSPGIGGLILSAGVWLWAYFNSSGRKTFARAALTGGVLGAILFFASALVSFDTPNTNRDFTLPFSEKKFEVSVRVLVWESSLKTISEHPFFGRGTGTGVAEVKYVSLSGGLQLLTDAHNVWLNQAGQLGIFGLAAFGALTFYLLRKCRFSLPDNSENSLVILAFSCAFLGAFLYQSLAGSYEDARHLWILFGLMAGFGVKKSGRQQPDL